MKIMHVHVHVFIGCNFPLQAPHEDIEIEKESQEGETPGSVTVAKHYRPRPPSVSLAAHLYMAPADQAGVVRRAVLGVSGRGRGNVVWQASSGQ